jgi:hypothetical protein
VDTIKLDLGRIESYELNGTWTITWKEIIWRRFWKNGSSKFELDSSKLRQDHKMDFCKHGDELLGFRETGNFITG